MGGELGDEARQLQHAVVVAVLPLQQVGGQALRHLPVEVRVAGQLKQRLLLAAQKAAALHALLHAALPALQLVQQLRQGVFDVGALRDQLRDEPADAEHGKGDKHDQHDDDGYLQGGRHRPQDLMK
jgi:hypothetical protein